VGEYLVGYSVYTSYKPGDYILVSPYLMHRHPDHWQDAEVFDPDRFANHDDIKKGSYLAFGLGAKSCPGQRYTLEVLKTFISQLLLNFDIALLNKPTLQHVGPNVATNEKMQINLTHRETTAAFKRVKKCDISFLPH